MTWKTVELKDVAIINSGNSAPQDKKLFKSGYFNFYRTSDVGRIGIGEILISKDKLNDLGILKLKKFEVGTILFPKSGASTFLNHRVILKKEGYVSSHLAGIKANNQLLEDKYLFYFLTTIDSKNLVQDSSYPSLNLSVIKKIKFLLPPLLIQQKIVAKIDKIFAEIDKATAAAEAKISNSHDLYSSSVTSFFKKLTEETVKLSSCSEIGYGYTSKSSIKFIGPKYLRITDIQNNRVNWSLVPNINKDLNKVKKFLLKEGDIVFARTGATTGKSYLVKNSPTSVFASYLIRVDANRDVVNPDYLRHFFQSKDYWNVINSGISGSAQGGFNASKLKKLKFPLPDKIKQVEIIKKLNEIEKFSLLYKNLHQKKIYQFNKLKQSILQQAFNGELVKAA